MDNAHKKISKLALAALEIDGTARDLLKPTEERVQECIRVLEYERAKHWEGKVSHSRIQDAITLLETLLSENKALRERVQLAEDAMLGYRKMCEIQAGAVFTEDPGQPEIAFYDKRSHVAVPREPTEAMMEAGQKIIDSDIPPGVTPCSDDIWDAMLTASSQEGE